jgi:membrane-bound lytic murein transglycosylase D
MIGRCLVLAGLLGVSAPAAPAVDEFDLSGLLEIDEAGLEQLCRQLQEKLQGEYVLDLAAVRDFARELLPLLDEFPEAAPYAAWLRARLDYLEVASELQLLVPPPIEPRPIPVQPSAVMVRKQWLDRMPRRPAVPATTEALVARLKPIFKAEQVPPELVWLAEVESSFNPRARSPVGAVGLYQIMPATAKFLQLSLWPFDQRLHPEKNGRAAARYLRYLRAKFADWRLTLAAYNAGEGTVRRTLQKHGAQTFDDIAIKLPAETQLYVPKVEAVLQRREGVALTDLPAMP